MQTIARDARLAIELSKFAADRTGSINLRIICGFPATPGPSVSFGPDLRIAVIGDLDNFVDGLFIVQLIQGDLE